MNTMRGFMCIELADIACVVKILKGERDCNLFTINVTYVVYHLLV